MKFLQLIRVGNKNNISLGITDYIEMFTLWEARTRYVLNYRLEKKKLDIAIKEVALYFENLENKIIKETDEIEI